MLMDAILKLHDKIMNMKLGPDRDQEITELEQARLNLQPLRVTVGINDLGSEL
jgi:NADH-quinone oxidoreductase subunit B